MCTSQNYGLEGFGAIFFDRTAKRPLHFSPRPHSAGRLIPSPVDLAPEIWRPVVGYEDRYEISSKGTVRSLPRTVGLRFLPSKVRQLIKKSNGYLSIQLQGTPRFCTGVHRLVALAFIPNPLNKPEVNHKDSNRLNNTWANLEWVTREENVTHAMLFGEMQKGRGNYRRGKRRVVAPNIVAKMMGDYSDRFNRPITQHQLAAKYNLPIDAVKEVIRQYTRSSRHAPEVVNGAIADYQSRKSTKLTTDAIAQKHGLTIFSLRGILRRAKRNLDSPHNNLNL